MNQVRFWADFPLPISGINGFRFYTTFTSKLMIKFKSIISLSDRGSFVEEVPNIKRFEEFLDCTQGKVKVKL